MALTQLTKIDGGGISTTSDYRVGVITASKFVGPFDGTAGNFSGIITASGANFSGNVTIGGTLTYEDVTNIDSVGIITAQKDIHVGAGVSAVGVGTFGSLDISGDIDVDGHTNLYNVSVAGVSTFSDNVIIAEQKELRLEPSGAFKLYRGAGGGGATNFIKSTFGSISVEAANAFIAKVNSNEDAIAAYANDRVDLYYNNQVKFTTTNTGAVVTGILTATSFSGDGSSLSNLPAGAPVGGASTNTVFFENDMSVGVGYSITYGKNAMSAGPISINAGVAVTVPSGSAWTIV